MKAEVEAAPALQTALEPHGAPTNLGPYITAGVITATVAAPSTTLVNADGSATATPTDLPGDDLDMDSCGSGAVVGAALLVGAVL